jgi:hypothetical protein
MALVNSDLFLVQDSVTKTNYKVSFQNLADQIDTDVNLDGRVAVSGDNMTGNLTLGTTNIVLNVDGSATFATDKIKLNTAGTLELWRPSTNGSDKLQSWASNIGNIQSERIRFNADGSALYLGDVTANAFVGDGSALTNLPVEPGLWEENGNNLSPITAGRNLTSVNDITAAGDLSVTGDITGTDITGTGDISAVNASFTGTLEAASIDGGTYS